MTRAQGLLLILLASLIGLAASFYDFNTRATGIDHSGGVELVIVSNALMLGAGLAVAVLGAGVAAAILMTLILLDIAGTGAAGWFLESPVLMGAMVLAALGWIIRVAARRKDL